MYFLYILRCDDNSLYTGITNDWKKRVSQHYHKDRLCAKYTKSHNVISLEAVWQVPDKSFALKVESRVKSLSKAQKELLINGTTSLISLFDDIDAEVIRLENINLNMCI